ncbi:MAG: 2Fe-2S iron-sulfur cluster binding domain-containing protein, partial [Desulfobacula sp.]|nr:2Fe-2S iron-sulfur cluster binding domain-containing protein [Desulfobacula sp.]
MINILVEPLGITVQIKKGETLHDGLENAGISIETPCGGLGICGACKAWVNASERVPSTPNENISREDDAQGLRLVCQAVPEGDITIRLEDNFVYDKAKRNQGKILVQKTQSQTFKPTPAVRITKHKDTFQLWYDRFSEPIILEEWQPKFKPKGLAIDIGTTTMVLSLVCLETGRILASGSSLNPQVIHGHDVMTRIQYAKTPQGRDEMASLV